ncbi:MAG: sulfatase [Phycisphaerales bacterium]|nr:MAG: sulfatase [Phycisphaerales bacterium]
MLRRLLPVFLSLPVALSSPACNRTESADAHESGARLRARPNVVLISVDMLRPDHLGCYGYSRDTSPSMDRLASEGALFENAVSTTSWTLPAHAALFTGLLDSVHGCVETTKPLNADHETLAEQLRASGYATGGFFSGPYLHPVFGLAQGFTKYVDCTSYPKLNATKAKRTGRVDGFDVWEASHRDITSPRVQAAASDWLKQNHERPFFLFVHFWDVHYDFKPPAPYDAKYDPEYKGVFTGDHFLFDQWITARMPQRDLHHLVALYDGEINWTDLHIGKLLDDLDHLRLSDSTLVVLVADHGTEFFEHGDKSHRKTLFEEVVRIPLIIRFPTHIDRDLRLSVPVSITDVLPTILDLTGLPQPNQVMGQSLVPLLRGAGGAADRVIVSELFSGGRKMRAVRRGNRKLIHDMLTGRSYVYNLVSDPGEQHPIFDESDAVFRVSHADFRRAQAWIQSALEGNPVASAMQPIPDDVRTKLQSLGYIGGSDDR